MQNHGDNLEERVSMNEKHRVSINKNEVDPINNSEKINFGENKSDQNDDEMTDSYLVDKTKESLIEEDNMQGLF